MSKIIGIDLGTTYSCVAHVDDYGVAKVIPNSINTRTTPSVVWFDGDRAIVGQEAKEMASIQFNSVCSFIKRNVGNDDFFFEVNGVRYSPEHVSSLILRKLVQDASEALGETITDVVITCPAYFFIKERNATKRAGEMAGLNVLQIVNEPTAAAVAYGVRPDEMQARESVVMVYDLGGGTFDVTLIHVTPNGLDVICTDGEHQLGGKDWDDCLVQHFADHITKKTGKPVDLDQMHELYQDLLHLAEKTKKQLTQKQSSTVVFSHEGERIRFDISREGFEEMTRSLVETTINLTQSVLDVAKQKGFDRFDKLILVGGSSRMPMIEKRLQEEFLVKPFIFDPDESVAKGAAIIGNDIRLRQLVKDKLQEQNSSLTLDFASPEQIAEATQSVVAETGYTLEIVQNAIKKNVRNVTSKSFGSIASVGYSEDGKSIRGIYNLIRRNTLLPTSHTMRFTTMEDNQPSVYLAVAENMDDEDPGALDANGMTKWIPLDESKIIWEGSIGLPHGLPARSPIDDTFQIDENGLLTYICEVPANGNRIVQQIETGFSEIADPANQQITQSCRDLIVE